VADAPAALNGWIILDKPYGMTSTQAVGAVKRLLREGGYPKAKVGHGGTLDPLATGVLPVALGEATKLAGRMLDSDKAYDFTIAFGAETDSLDLEGQVVETSDVRPAHAAIEAILPRFTGAIEQVPPAFSALKVDGRRAYDLARAGEAVALAGRKVTIHALRASASPREQRERTRRHADAEGLDCVTLSASVSKGTYVRSLARDIARALGAVGHVAMLRRTRAGPFGLDRAISLDILAEKAKARALEDITLPLRTALVDIPALALSPEQARLVRNGQVLTGIAAPDGLALATLADVPVALVECHAGAVTVERGFNL
jgi:tRNA pseudouridine55 synthase